MQYTWETSYKNNSIIYNGICSLYCIENLLIYSSQRVFQQSLIIFRVIYFLAFVVNKYVMQMIVEKIILHLSNKHLFVAILYLPMQV